jgi:outer membrane protein assembly factor BamB
MNGAPLWKVDLGILNAGWFYDPDYEWGVASSPIIWRDMVIVQCDIQKDSFVAAYRLKDGKQVWKTMRDEIPSWATPTIYDGKPRPELVTHATRFIRGYDPATGKELWRLGPNSEVTSPTPIVAHGLIYVTNGYRGIQPIYAIRPGASGDISLKPGQESSEFIAWSKQRGGPYTPTPVIYGGLFYALSNNGVLSAFDAKTGERIYQQRVGPGGSYSASPVAADGKIYLSSEDGDVHVVKAGPKYELLTTNPVGEVIMATPAISGELLIIRGMKHVVAVSAR